MPKPPKTATGAGELDQSKPGLIGKSEFYARMLTAVAQSEGVASFAPRSLPDTIRACSDGYACYLLAMGDEEGFSAEREQGDARANRVEELTKRNFGGNHGQHIPESPVALTTDPDPVPNSPIREAFEKSMGPGHKPAVDEDFKQDLIEDGMTPAEAEKAATA